MDENNFFLETSNRMRRAARKTKDDDETALLLYRGSDMIAALDTNLHTSIRVLCRIQHENRALKKKLDLIYDILNSGQKKALEILSGERDPNDAA